MAEGSLAVLRREAALPVTMHLTAVNGYAPDIMAALPGAIHAGDALRLSCAQDQKLPMLSRIAALEGKIADLEVVPPSLEDIYSHFSRRDGQ